MFTKVIQSYSKWPIAIDSQGGMFNRSDVESLANQFARLCEVRPLVLILSENAVGVLAGLLACWEVNAVPLMIGATGDKSIVERYLRHYAPGFVWLPESYPHPIEGKALVHAMGYRLIQREAESPTLHPDLALLLPTSGSTGSPKLVRHSRNNIISSARNVARMFELGPEERPVAGLPLHFTMGLSVATSHLYAEATVLLTRATVTEADFWTFIRAQRATSFTGVPYSYEMLHRLRFARMDLPHLRTLYQGGGKLREPVFRSFAEHASERGRRFFATYGQTEGTARMACLPHEHACERIGSIGKAIPEGHFSLVDEQGAELRESEATGELVYRGPNVTLGYAFEPEDLAKGDEFGGVLHTGDIARRDQEGFHYIVGRKSRFLKLYGLRISMDEIEQIVKREFATECLAGGTDEQLRVCVDAPDIADAVKRLLAEKTGLYHGAITVVQVDGFQRNDGGKLLFPNPS